VAQLRGSSATLDPHDLTRGHEVEQGEHGDMTTFGSPYVGPEVDVLQMMQVPKTASKTAP